MTDGENRGRAEVRRLIEVLGAESGALARGDVAGAGALLARKLAAAAELVAMLPHIRLNAAEATAMRDALEENGASLSLAIEVQTRVAELVLGGARGSHGDKRCSMGHVGQRQVLTFRRA